MSALLQFGQHLDRSIPTVIVRLGSVSFTTRLGAENVIEVFDRTGAVSTSDWRHKENPRTSSNTPKTASTTWTGPYGSRIAAETRHTHVQFTDDASLRIGTPKILSAIASLLEADTRLRCGLAGIAFDDRRRIRTPRQVADEFEENGTGESVTYQPRRGVLTASSGSEVNSKRSRKGVIDSLTIGSPTSAIHLEVLDLRGDSNRPTDTIRWVLNARGARAHEVIRTLLAADSFVDAGCAILLGAFDVRVPDAAHPDNPHLWPRVRWLDELFGSMSRLVVADAQFPIDPLKLLELDINQTARRVARLHHALGEDPALLAWLVRVGTSRMTPDDWDVVRAFKETAIDADSPDSSKPNTRIPPHLNVRATWPSIDLPTPTP